VAAGLPQLIADVWASHSKTQAGTHRRTQRTATWYALLE